MNSRTFGTFDDSDIESLANGDDFHLNNLKSFIDFVEKDSKVGEDVWKQVWEKHFVEQDGMLRDLFYKYVQDDSKIEDVDGEYKEQVVNILRVMDKHASGLIQKRIEKLNTVALERNDFFKLKKNMHHAYIEPDVLKSAPLTPVSKITSILVVGDSKVGKTHFLSAYKGNSFETEVKPIESTVSCEQKINEGDKEVIYKVDVVDSDSIVGDSEDRIKLLRKADVVVVMFSVTDYETLSPGVEKSWVREIMMIAPKARWILCGNKVDQRCLRLIAENLKKNTFFVTPEDGVAMAKSYRFHSYLEVSCKMNRNISAVVDIALRSVYGEYRYETIKGQSVTNTNANTKDGKCSLM